MDGIDKNIFNDVKKIIDDVKHNGDEALIKYTNEFDGPAQFDSRDIEVSEDERQEGSESISPELRDILNKAADNIRNYAEKQNTYKDCEMDNNGIHIKNRFIPIESVGVYVPGGEYSYPSTVLMCVIPAKVAGVEEVTMVTPFRRLTPAVFAAAQIAGVDKIYQVGGAQAIAALAFGTRAIKKVDKIVGPGNIYVQTAKLIVSEVVGIDMIAGPSEVVIIADEFQDSQLIAADLMAQAEHAGDASSILVTYSQELINNVKNQVTDWISGRIKYELVNDLNMAAERSNSLAPEHLQIMCSEENINKIEGKIKNAGAVFLGSNTPVAVGDYWAGPSHTLPTGGSARYQEGLNVRSFLKKVSFIKCTGESIKESAPLVEKFAKEEGMKYHAESVRKRLKE